MPKTLQALLDELEAELLDGPSRQVGSMTIRSMRLGRFMQWTASMGLDGLSVKIGRAEIGLRLSSLEPQEMKRLAALIASVFRSFELESISPGKAKQMEVESRQLSQYLRCNPGPKTQSLIDEIVANWRDPILVRRERADKAMRKAVKVFRDAGMSQKDMLQIWDEMEIQKVHES